jgi:hypothetical protein
MLLNSNGRLLQKCAGTALLHSLQIANLLRSEHTKLQKTEITKEGFSGNQDALRLPSKKKPAQSQVK